MSWNHRTTSGLLSQALNSKGPQSLFSFQNPFIIKSASQVNVAAEPSKATAVSATSVVVTSASGSSLNGSSLNVATIASMLGGASPNTSINMNSSINNINSSVNNSNSSVINEIQQIMMGGGAGGCGVGVGGVGNNNTMTNNNSASPSCYYSSVFGVSPPARSINPVAKTTTLPHPHHSSSSVMMMGSQVGVNLPNGSSSSAHQQQHQQHHHAHSLSHSLSHSHSHSHSHLLSSLGLSPAASNMEEYFNTLTK